VQRKRYTLSFNGATLKDGHTMFTADVIKDLNRKSYLEAENKQLKEDIAEKQSLFDLQHTRTLEASAMWQAETGKDYFPDLGELIRWLMEKAAGSLDKPASKE